MSRPFPIEATAVQAPQISLDQSIVRSVPPLTGTVVTAAFWV